jgi:hypothetical protein
MLSLSFFRKLGVTALVLGIGITAQAQTYNFVMGSGAPSAFYVSTSPAYGGYNSVLDAGGNMEATLDGDLLVASYCVDLFNPVYVGATYDVTTFNTTGSVFGNPVANAGSVAWLITTFGASAVTPDEHRALQAAVWRTLYGSNFEVDGADNAIAGNNATMISTYQGYIAALGSNTAPVDSVLWISPQSTNPAYPGVGYSLSQGVVGLRSSASAGAAAPEPGTIALLGLGVAGLIARRRKAA